MKAPYRAKPQSSEPLWNSREKMSEEIIYLVFIFLNNNYLTYPKHDTTWGTIGSRFNKLGNNGVRPRNEVGVKLVTGYDTDTGVIDCGRSNKLCDLKKKCECLYFNSCLRFLHVQFFRNVKQVRR